MLDTLYSNPPHTPPLPEHNQRANILEPASDAGQWRFVDRAGAIRTFGVKQMALVQHLGSHACTVSQAAEAVGMDYTGAIKALVKPHVKALLLRVVDMRKVTLRSGALSVLESVLFDPAVSPAERARLALRVLEATEGVEGLTGQHRSSATKTKAVLVGG